MSRYEQLRSAVANLARSAEEQVRYLDELHAPLTGEASADGYGNDELALELDDIFHAANDMIAHGELTEAQRKAIAPLDELLRKWSGQENFDFWRREALFQDDRRAQVRACAAQCLARLPDEERVIGRSV